MLQHAVQKLIDGGHPAARLCYVSIDSPVYIGLGLEQLLRYYREAAGIDSLSGAVVIFDEIQYLRDWEVHLKKLVEDYREVKFVVSGSAAAALRMKSTESGAGRFTDFRLPPLTFHEFLDMLGRAGLVDEPEPGQYRASDVVALNDEFIRYLNFGGYPEALFSQDIQADPRKFIRSDIIDKVLLRDLPQLYGIEDIQELNRLFTMLAYNTGDEVSLESLSQGSGVAKNTIKRYLEYLQAAFLVTILHRVDQSGRMFRRANYFKVYLANPSMRGALFGPISREHEAAGAMAETAVISQWQHSSVASRLFYARWAQGEVDLVTHDGQKARGCVEIKWSDRHFDNPGALRNLWTFAQKNGLDFAATTTLTASGEKQLAELRVLYHPTSLYCYMIGRRTLRSSAALTL